MNGVDVAVTWRFIRVSLPFFLAVSPSVFLSAHASTHARSHARETRGEKERKSRQRKGGEIGRRKTLSFPEEGRSLIGGEEEEEDPSGSHYNARD